MRCRRSVLEQALLVGTLLFSAAGCASGGSSLKETPTGVMAGTPRPKAVIEVPGISPDEDIRAISLGDRTIVILPRADGRGGRQAHYVAIDPKGRIAWEASHACPNFADREELNIAAGQVICRVDRSITAVSVKNGRERWRWVAPDRLDFSTVAGDRVLASVDQQELVVIEASSGRVTRRIDLDGRPFKAAVNLPDGPLALIIGERPGLGEEEDGHTLIAQPVGGAGTRAGGLEPLTPRWEKPFDAWSSTLMPSAGAVLGMPREGLLVSRDMATGDLNWLDVQDLLPRHWVLTSHLAVAGSREDGVSFVAALDPVNRLVRWQHRWPFEAPPETAGEHEQHTMFANAQGWMVYRSQDGKPVAGGRYGAGATLRTLQVSKQAATLSLDVDGRRQVHHVPFGDAPKVAPLGEAPAEPAWLVAGTELHYVMLLYHTRDPETGYLGTARVESFVVTIKSVSPSLTYHWQRGDGRSGTRVLPAAFPPIGRHRADRTLDALPGLVIEPEAPENAAVSGAILTDLQEIQSMQEDGFSAFRPERMDQLGTSYHHVTMLGRDGERPVELETVCAEDRAGGGRYWLAPYRDYPLIIRAQRPHMQVFLTRLTPGEAPEGEQEGTVTLR